MHSQRECAGKSYLSECLVFVTLEMFTIIQRERIKNRGGEVEEGERKIERFIIEILRETEIKIKMRDLSETENDNKKEIKKAVERELRDREQRDDPEGWLASCSGCRSEHTGQIEKQATTAGTARA